ncbi:MAG: zinc ribbon domain-containing protein [Candidatus Thorarchaeota archaeon]
MKIRELLLLVVGIVMLGLGALLVTNSGSGGVFVFPFFFFFGDPALAPIMVIFSLVIIVIFFWWANSNYPEDQRFSKYQEPRVGVLKIGSMCQVCGNPLPENASFCSSCGSSVDLGGNESF